MLLHNTKVERSLKLSVLISHLSVKQAVISGYHKGRKQSKQLVWLCSQVTKGKVHTKQLIKN